ncbi:hypothetical protein [Cupriavidus numazuensis]|uniref:Lipoprotein n=1 Tax=Cupriavidus numazuensis TaxID=221992 RepID=A0ABM8TX11_9BURK|nr:hypothetical protein [Cupriavidus numazuensis]CAG2161350.1 hypothetical protein LMG26411_08175 [Cupriavidus numazuensis]
MKAILIAVAVSVGLVGCNQEQASIAPASSPAASLLGNAAQAAPSSRATGQAQVSWDGPFGLRMGLSKAEVRAALSVMQETSDTIVLGTVPKPYPLFEAYGLIFGTPGLCKVLGLATNLQTDSGGFAARQRIDALASELEARYGKPYKKDFLMAGSIWKEPQEWVTALRKQERYYGYFWSKASGAKLPAEIDSIGLNTTADQRDRVQVTLGYEFTNFSECLKETKAKEQAGL